MSNPEKKAPWDLGWDAVMSVANDGPVGEDEQEVVSAALSALSSGYDLTDHESRVDLILFLVNDIAHTLTLPHPTDEDEDPLDTPEKYAAFDRRRGALAAILADAFVKWEASDNSSCAECGESLALDAEPAKEPSKAN